MYNSGMRIFMDTLNLHEVYLNVLFILPIGGLTDHGGGFLPTLLVGPPPHHPYVLFSFISDARQTHLSFTFL